MDPFRYVDRRLRPVIKVLNRRGYRTLYSCAGGHPVPESEEEEQDSPYITIEGDYSSGERKGQLVGLLTKLGLKNVQVQSYPMWTRGTVTNVYFEPLGGPPAVVHGKRSQDHMGLRILE